MTSDKPPIPRLKVAIGSRPPDTTLAIRIDSPDPSIEGLRVLPVPSEDKMRKMRAKAELWKVVGSLGKGIEVKEAPLGSGNFVYAACGTGLVLTGDPTVQPIPGEFRYQTMPRTMKGFYPLKIHLEGVPAGSRVRKKPDGGMRDELTFYYFNTRTRHVFFLFYDVSMYDLYEVPRIMGAGVDLKRMDHVLDEKGTERYLSRITEAELSAMLALAARAPSSGTLALSDDSENIRWRVLQGNLRLAAEIRSLAPGFDMRAFVEKMQFAFPSIDEYGSHYGINTISGDAQEDYRLYVNPLYSGAPAGCVAVASFRYNRDFCMLFREV